MKNNIINYQTTILSILLFALFFVNPAFSSSSRNLIVFVEPNMVMAMTKISRIYSQKNNVIVSVNFGSSEDALNTIDSGEPSDVLISAHHELIENLRQKGLVDVYNVGYIARDKMVLVNSKSNPVKISATTVENYLQILDQNKATLVIDYEGTSSGKIVSDFLKNFELPNITLLRKLPEDKSSVTKPLESDLSLYALILNSQFHQKNYLNLLAKKPENTIFYQALVVAGDNMEVAREFLKFLKSETAKRIFIESGFSVD